MKKFHHPFQLKPGHALLAGIVAGCCVLSLIISFLVNDNSAVAIFWIGIGISMVPLFTSGKSKTSTPCKSMTNRPL